MSSSVASKVKKHKTWARYHQVHRKCSIQENLTGFLCTHNGNEKQCLLECFNLLNSYIEGQTAADDNVAVSQYPAVTDSDIIDDLSHEVAQAKQGTDSTTRLKNIPSGAKNVEFICASRGVIEPSKLALTILQDISEEKKQCTRFLHKLLPVEVTCKAQTAHILNAFQPLCKKYFTGQPVTFAVNFKHRNNHDINKDEVISAIADLVQQTGVEHKVDLTNANIVINVDIIRSYAFLGIIFKYFEYKKYNLIEASRS